MVALTMPYTIYAVVHGGFPPWTPDEPLWVIILGVISGAGVFVLFAWGAVAVFIDVKRRP